MEYVVPDGFHILHAVDGQIGFPGDQRPVQFLGPERLAPDVRERPVLNPVATGLDGDDFDRVGGPAMGGDQRLRGHARLRQGERRSPGAQAQRPAHVALWGEKHIQLALMTSGIRWKRQ